MEIRMKNSYIYIVLFCISIFNSCDYLDMVPDNIPTMDMVFTTRQNAYKMLATCYKYIPKQAHPGKNPGLSGGDEIWNTKPDTWYYKNLTCFNIARGNQNANDPYLNYWSGGQDGSNLFIGIRDCNTFIENVDNVLDMPLDEKMRWKAEVKVIKAYLHYYLLQLYGPIPFVDENIDVAASIEEMSTVREPVDDVVDKIVALLDDATQDESLPMSIQLRDSELGRLTKPAALAIKAKVLLLAASPLFNGNPDFIDFKNKEGVSFINPVDDPSKWEKAREACKAAIDAAHEGGHQLYKFDDIITIPISETTRQELTLRATITSRFNQELIWGLGNNSTDLLQQVACPPLTAYQQGSCLSTCIGMHNPTLDVAEQFYTNNGVPIDEDKTWDYENRYKVDTVPEGHEYYVEAKAKTAKLNYFREPRFYAYLGFDRGKWFNLEVADDKQSYVVRNKMGEMAGRISHSYSITGYFAKKLVNYKRVLTQANNTESTSTYAFPIIRLSDLYLMYAEALNETKSAPDAEVYQYVQYVRDKAGLDKNTGGLVQTWQQYSSNPGKPKTQIGMREIIRDERLIELVFEGQRFFDLRRWRLCMDYFNRPIRGWNITGTTEEDYYQVSYIYFKKFTLKDYFWPIRLKDLYVNRNLIQSPYWEQ